MKIVRKTMASKLLFVVNFKVSLNLFSIRLNNDSTMCAYSVVFFLGEFMTMSFFYYVILHSTLHKHTVDVHMPCDTYVGSEGVRFTDFVASGIFNAVVAIGNEAVKSYIFTK